jgi:hypothetical protein
LTPTPLPSSLDTPKTSAHYHHDFSADILPKEDGCGDKEMRSSEYNRNQLAVRFHVPISDSTSSEDEVEEDHLPVISATNNNVKFRPPKFESSESEDEGEFDDAETVLSNNPHTHKNMLPKKLLDSICPQKLHILQLKFLMEKDTHLLKRKTSCYWKLLKSTKVSVRKTV